MRSDATHLMFIDSDIGFNPQDVLALLGLMTDESEYDVMGGPYPKKCISWEKIKQAVDKGVADEDPNTLEKYVGDYVFNPKASTTQIPLGEPVEVLEIGTGFMMVQRRAFEKYKEAYPYLSYRPDHVRTDHFDGSREIHAYFDCIIDRGFSYQALHNLLEDVANGKSDLQEAAKAIVNNEKESSKRYLSEDYNFCYHAQKCGVKVWFCPWMKLQHVGSYIFGGSLVDLAQIGAAATADVAKIGGKSKK